LQSCPHNEDKIRARHDDALALIVKAITKANPKATVLVNQTMPHFEGPTLKPDIQVYNLKDKPNEAIILDLAMAFEDSEVKDNRNVFERTAEGKNMKYQPLSRHLTSLGHDVYNVALLYGSLGSVSTKNLAILTTGLGLAKSVAHKLQVKISTMNIKASRRIWAHHCAAQHANRRPGGFDKAVTATNLRKNDRKTTPGHTAG
jgi:hypothetical protein